MLTAVFKGKSSVAPFLGAGIAALIWYLSFPGNWHVIAGALVGGFLNMVLNDD